MKWKNEILGNMDKTQIFTNKFDPKIKLFPV